MNIILIICLIYMLAIFGGVVWNIIRLKRKDRIKYIKSFKKGKFTLIYFVAIPLYFLAYRFNGVDLTGTVWLTIKSSIEIVVLKFDYSTASALMAHNVFYSVVIQMAFTLVLLNALMLTFSVWGQKFINAISLWYTRKFRKKVVVVVGYNANNMDIVKSVTKKHGKAVLMASVTPEMRDDAYVYHADCVNLAAEDDIGAKLLRIFRKFDDKKVSVIINCEDDKTNIRYINQLCDMIEKQKLTELPLTKDCGLQVHVFGSKENESTFVHFVEKSKGLVRFVNRHKQIATNFVLQYPLTQFMTEEQLDYSTATVRENVNLNVVMVGFGNLNETLLLTSISNNQFLTQSNGKLQPKLVNYHLFDKQYPYGKFDLANNSVHSRSLNHGYWRYDEFLSENLSNQKDYLEFVDKPAHIHLHSGDISHPDFYSTLEHVLAKENSYTYVIVSFGSDMENLELAEKLVQKIHEWSISSFVKIFVKMRDEKLYKEVRRDFQNDYVQIFGTNQAVVYNADNILNEETELMARLRHVLYTAEGIKKQHEQESVTIEEKVEQLARDKWYNKFKQFQRESNVFACLSIRMKLHLLGFDYSYEGKDCAEQFEKIYEAGDKRNPSQLYVEGKCIWNYTNDEQWRNSVRWTYAVQEHQRWCANMICNGIIPASRQDIEKDGGRILDKRIHGNLTTMQGLVEYRELVANATGRSTEETDVIRYDYQIMDDVVWLLHKSGYKVIEKKR